MPAEVIELVAVALVADPEDSSSACRSRFRLVENRSERQVPGYAPLLAVLHGLLNAIRRTEVVLRIVVGIEQDETMVAVGIHRLSS